MHDQPEATDEERDAGPERLKEEEAMRQGNQPDPESTTEDPEE